MAQQTQQTSQPIQDRQADVEDDSGGVTDGGIELQDAIECPECGEMGAYRGTKLNPPTGELFIRRYCSDCEKAYDASMEVNLNAGTRDDPEADHSGGGLE